MTISWLADKIEQWPTTRLVPYARNARTHSPEQVAQIAASIAEFGFTNPILAGEMASSSRGTVAWLRRRSSDWKRCQSSFSTT